MSDEYTKLLDSAIEKIPKRTSSGERFELPSVQGVRIGNRTIIQNFKEIADRMNRNPHHILKFNRCDDGWSPSDLSRCFQGPVNK
jgi:translation initiation factor 2 subunit 2